MSFVLNHQSTGRNPAGSGRRQYSSFCISQGTGGVFDEGRSCEHPVGLFGLDSDYSMQVLSNVVNRYCICLHMYLYILSIFWYPLS